MRKDKVVSFRMNDNDEQILNKCFKTFSYAPKEVNESFTKKMLWLIYNIHGELDKLNRELKSKDNEIIELKSTLEPKLGLEPKDKKEPEVAPIDPKLEKPIESVKSKPVKVESDSFKDLNKCVCHYCSGPAVMKFKHVKSNEKRTCCSYHGLQLKGSSQWLMIESLRKDDIPIIH